MTLTHTEKFNVLLTQLGITDLFEDVHNGELSRIDISKEERLWHMHFTFETHLPFVLYNMLQTKLHEHFSHIANVTFEIKVKDDTYLTDRIREYIPYAIDQTGMSPSLKGQLKQKLFNFSGDVLKFQVVNEIEQKHFEKSCNGKLKAAFKQAGFQLSQIIFEVSDEDQLRELASLEAHIQEEEAQQSVLLREKMVEREKQKAESVTEEDRKSVV